MKELLKDEQKKILTQLSNGLDIPEAEVLQAFFEYGVRFCVASYNSTSLSKHIQKTSGHFDEYKHFNDICHVVGKANFLASGPLEVYEVVYPKV